MDNGDAAFEKWYYGKWIQICQVTKKENVLVYSYKSLINKKKYIACEMCDNSKNFYKGLFRCEKQ